MPEPNRIPTARDRMDTQVPVLSPQMDVLEAVAVLAKHHLAAAPVVDKDFHLLGMLTEKDSLRILSASAFYNPRSGKVSDHMSAVRLCLEPEMDLFRVAEVFLGNNFPVLPVLDEGRLVGCLSRQQLLSGIMQLADDRFADVLEIEETARETGRRPRSIEKMQNLFASYSRKQLVSKLGRKT